MTDTVASSLLDTHKLYLSSSRELIIDVDWLGLLVYFLLANRYHLSLKFFAHLI